MLSHFISPLLYFLQSVQFTTAKVQVPYDCSYLQPWRAKTLRFPHYEKKSLKGNSNFAQLVQHLNKVNLTSIQGKLEFTVNRANRSHNLDKASYSST